ncbi:polycystic kidney disease 1 like 1 [Fundulus heteroclitus]|uniref:polycystic kidney disease 1 like 1 n=1 Tax=Fundulus heteroclitus TaxID=8078 RepID=UPI00165ACC45|nr:polycystic kidney disease 1 like 1 [Fundulus heteroclitus]
MCVKGKRKLRAKDITAWQPPAQSKQDKTVRIYAERQVYPTNKDVIFLVVTDIPDPLEFFWDFGDSKLARTSLRTVTKRYDNPGSYKVVVAASWGETSVASDVFPVEVQRAVKLSRLVHQASVLRNQTLTMRCRVSAGTNLTFMWSFADGPTRPGPSTAHHVFHRLGEFVVKVTASNLISSASLSSHVFVVDRACQPPPVKRMGPLKLQFQRQDVIHLGVTFEADVDCDISDGLDYTWTLFGSGGQIIPLPDTDTQSQSLMLPSHLLQYDTYTATARVQVIGSVVYSNYTMTFQVKPRPPVAFIQGGTNFFIGKESSNMVTLDGQKSYDPDFPRNLLSYRWTCKPVSIIASSCFHQDIPTSSPVLRFPTSLLEPKFDQFQFTLTVTSGARSASSEAFLTVASHLTGKVSVFCHQCLGDRVNWDQPFSVSALCEDCSVRSELTEYTWSLYLVNASSKPIIEVPFCFTVDASDPSAIRENPTTSTLTPETSSLHPPVPRLSSSEPSQTSVLDHISLIDASGEFPRPGSDDYDVSYPSVEEGDPRMSAGRLNEAESFNPGDESVFDLTLLNNEGSNLVDPKPSVANREPTLLDLHQDAVERGLFESYTYTGISSTLLTFRPFSLRPRSMYMLQVTAKSQNNLIGRTQLFLKTNPAPEGVACQVQPEEGLELHTPFSIFCSSGRADLEYKYSYSVGGNPPWILYQGRDFQYYFSLPSGDPSDDYKVTIYTEIKSSGSGSATKPCPVTVRVRPSFLRNTSSSSSYDQDPALKLSESLRNLSTLIQLGNPVEIRNFILLLTSVLNRLSQDAEANACAQRHTRNVLICTLCELQSGDQKSLTDNIFILNELLRVTNQVTLMSVRHVASHVRSVSEKLPEVSADQATLHSLITSLSHCLLVVTGCSCTPETPQAFNSTRVSGAGSLVAESREDSENASDGCAQSPSSTPDLEHGGAAAAKRLAQLGEEILRSAADLMLRHVLSLEAKAHRVETGLMTLLASSQNRSSSIIRGGFTSVHMPAALIQRVFGRHTGGARPRQQQPCVLRVLTELSRSFYPRDTRPPHHKTTPACFSQLTGPVVDLSLFECSTRRKIHIHPLPEPVNTEMQLPQRNESSQHILLRGQVSYHNFSISQELLQRAIQVTVVFTPPSSRPFPIMLLFRMFERPTPSMHHLQRIHQWEQNTMRLTLPPSYLNAAGVAHIALLDADFRRVPRRKLQSQQIRYSVTVDSSLCLSWDGQQGVWTRHDCRTHQTDSSPAVTCSCYHLRPLTVFQQQVQSSQDTGPLDPFLSPSSDLTVLSTLAVLLVLYILGLLWSHRADVVSKENQKAHYVSDNDPADPYLYAVCVHTGLCSAARMTAKVYIVLYGADGFSQTKELQVPGCSLFRRNATDTFILSAADSLGPVWGVHIWHDNSGSSPDWYLKRVVVSEVNGGRAEARSWLFVGECWLAVNKGDGRVERMLRVCSEETHFAKTLLLRFSDFSADFHTWLCVHGCPSPSSFTQTQRLSVCMLLVLGYACANAVIISRTDDQLPFEVGVVDVSVVSVTTGLLSVMVALPVATLTSLLFRLTGNRAVASRDPRANHTKTARGDFQGIFSANNSALDYRLPWDSRWTWTQEALRKKYQDTDILSASSVHENKGLDEEATIQTGTGKRTHGRPVFEGSKGAALLISKEQNRDQTPEGRAEKRLAERRRYEADTPRGDADPPVGKQFSPRWYGCQYLAWAAWGLLSLSCLAVTAEHGMRFSSSKALLWIHSLCFSLMACMFLIQPALIFAVATIVSIWHKKAADSRCVFSGRKSQMETSLRSKSDADGAEDRFTTSAVCQETSPSVERLLRARQRARLLRLARPPTPAELRRTRRKRRREALIQETLRDSLLCAVMLLLTAFIISGSSVEQHQSLNEAVKRHFTGKSYSVNGIKTHEDWWKWTQSVLLDSLYQESSAKTEQPHVLIGEPVVQKRDFSRLCRNPTLANQQTREGPCPEEAATVSFGRTKSEAASKLKSLRTSSWVGRRTVALKVQFAVYSPAPRLFSSVSLVAERRPDGALLTSASVRSVRVLHSPALRDHVATVCQLLFLFLSLLQASIRASSAAQQGLMGCWRRPSTWLDAVLLAVTLVCYGCFIRRSSVIVDVARLLQTQHRGHVDVGAVANWEQNIRTVWGVILFLLSVKCVALLGLNRTFSSSAAVLSQTLSSLFWLLVSGLTLLLALSGSATLLYAESSWAFSSLPRSLQTLLCHYRGPRVTQSRLHAGQDVSHWALRFLTTTAVWTAMVIGAISSLAKTAQRAQRRNVDFTTGELLGYLKTKLSELTGRKRHVRTDDYDKRRTYALEELESSVDELLFRLSVLSNTMQHTLRAHGYREEASPVISASPPSSHMETQECLTSKTMVEKIKRENKATHEAHKGTSSSASHLFSTSSQVEAEMQTISEGTDEVLKMKNWLASSEPTSLKRLMAEDICDNRPELQTRANGSCWFIKTHSKVVEALVHNEPGTGKP